MFRIDDWSMMYKKSFASVFTHFFFFDNTLDALIIWSSSNNDNYLSYNNDFSYKDNQHCIHIILFDVHKFNLLFMFIQFFANIINIVGNVVAYWIIRFEIFISYSEIYKLCILYNMFSSNGWFINFVLTRSTTQLEW